jgi:hypothetical protein
MNLRSIPMIRLGAMLLGLSLCFPAVAAPGVFRFLTETLPEGTTNSNYNVRVVVANATGAVTFSIVANPDLLPAGLSLDGATGLITGIPTATANNNLIVRATDDLGNLDLPVNLKVSAAGGGGSPDVHFTTTALPDGTVGQAYATTLDVDGGTGPYTYITDGLPLGLSLNGATGIVSGTPSEPGTFFVSMTAYDESDNSKTVKILPLTVLPAESNFRFTTLVFDNGEVGAYYEDQYLTADAAATPVTYAVAGLPPGLAFDTVTAAVTGTPTTAGTFRVEVTADDGETLIRIAQRIIIAPGAGSNLYWDFTGLPAAIRNVLYTNQPPVLVAAVNGTTMAYAADGLPDGIVYNVGTGELSGTPVAPIGIYPVTFTATDSAPNPDETITLNAEFIVMGPNGGDTKSLAANFFVLKQTFKRGVPGRDSWSATVLYNADRTAGNTFDPAIDTFRIALGNAEIALDPGDLIAKSAVLYTYKSAPTETTPVVYDVKIYADKQLIKIKTSKDTLVDAVPGELLNLLDLGDMGGRIKEYLGEKGKFNILVGYRNTGFACAKAKLTRKGAGLDKAQLQLYLASPGFSYLPGDTVRIRLLDAADAVLLDKDATTLVTGTQKVDSATGATIYALKKALKDPAATDILGNFKYDNKKGKMDIKLSAMDLSLLADLEENLTVEVTIRDTVYSTTLTVFDPSAAGKYSEKMPK